MQSLKHSLILTGCALFITGCTRTYISSGKPEQRSPDGMNYVSLVGHGAYGKAYSDQTKKLLDVQIERNTGTNETVLFSHRYKFVAADMSWSVRWTSPETLIVDVFDFAPGVTVYDAQKTGAASNHIATLMFITEKKTNKFVEDRQPMGVR
jgi:hypothetical protein